MRNWQFFFSIWCCRWILFVLNLRKKLHLINIWSFKVVKIVKSTPFPFNQHSTWKNCSTMIRVTNFVHSVLYNIYSKNNEKTRKFSALTKSVSFSRGKSDFVCPFGQLRAKAEKVSVFLVQSRHTQGKQISPSPLQASDRNTSRKTWNTHFLIVLFQRDLGLIFCLRWYRMYHKIQNWASKMFC